ncbi:MAG: DUF5667 domain-containing protein [Patescibacteria group bacterium]
MLRRAIFATFVLLTALGVLFVSIYRATTIRFDFSEPNNSATGEVFTSSVEYSLPYPGILPDHPLWIVKAARDGTILFTTVDSYKKAQKNLFLADSRLVMARELQENGKDELSVSTALKAQGYLAEALEWGKDADVRGYDSSGFYETLYKSSLVHREVLEEIMQNLPEEARPIVNQAVGQTTRITQDSVVLLQQKGKAIPQI